MALYDAFISYSHAKDKPIAAALQSVVQKLGKPWYRRRALRATDWMVDELGPGSAKSDMAFPCQ